MKKALKIIGITLGSIVVLALVLAGVTVAMLTSSGRLTKMVKKYAPQFITCEMQLDKADLTLFKTFPNVGIDIEKVALINPMAGSPSDTIANIDNLIVVLDAKKLWKEKEIVVRKCILEDAFVNYYVDSLGNNSFDIFNAKNDEEDTNTSFDYGVDIEEVRLKNTTLLYTDGRSGMAALAKGLDLNLKGKMQDDDINANLAIKADDLSLNTKDMQLALNALDLDFEGDVTDLDQIEGMLKLSTPDISLSLGEAYLQNDTLDLNLPLQLCLSDQKLHLSSSQIGLNQYLIQLDGDAEMAENKDVNLDLKLSTNTLVVEDVLTYLPEKVQRSLGDIEYSGKLSIVDAVVQGTYNDSLMPLISAKIMTDDVVVNVPSLPYPFTDVDLEANLNLDMNSNAGSVAIKNMKTKFNESDLKVRGTVDDLLGDVGLKTKVTGNVPMSDLKVFLPDGLGLNGRATLDLTTDFTVDQLMKTLDDYNPNRLSAVGKIKVSEFSCSMDTIHATAPTLIVDLKLPASLSKKNHISCNANRLTAKAGEAISADLKGLNVDFSVDNLKGGVEKMLLDATLNLSKMDMVYDTINLQLDRPVITFVTTPDRHPQGIKARVGLNANSVTAKTEKEYDLSFNLLKFNTSVSQDKGKSGFLDQWNPKASVKMGNAVVKVDWFDEKIRLDHVDFQIDPSELIVNEISIRIGNSDFSLQGNINGIKEWAEDHKNLMKGELNVTSDMCNVNEIMDLTSGLGASPESVEESDDEGGSPFMVPLGVDFRFTLHTKRALYDNFDLNNLGGGMTVKNGTLILQEIGFTNKAAEMQLTAMYQSPSKNNLALSMDFHLLNVKINDLLHMIPYIDTLVPMLKTFDGQAEFHIGADIHLNSNYEPKMSTFLAAADIEGKNLTVNDKFTFTKITDMLGVSTNGEYRVDSLDVQLTARRNNIDLWPSQIAIGKYKVTVDGRMDLDKNGAYHLSVTESPIPARFGLSVSGPLNNLEYKLEKSKFPTLYKPNKRTEREEMYLKLKKDIANRLKENVR